MYFFFPLPFSYSIPYKWWRVSQGWVARNPVLELHHQEVGQLGGRRLRRRLRRPKHHCSLGNQTLGASTRFEIHPSQHPISRDYKGNLVLVPSAWQQTSLQEDAFEHSFLNISFSRKDKKLRSSAETGFLPMHTHLCFKHLSYLAQ